MEAFHGILTLDSTHTHCDGGRQASSFGMYTKAEPSKVDRKAFRLSRTVLLHRVADGANGSDVAFREAILIRVNDDSRWIDFEG